MMDCSGSGPVCGQTVCADNEICENGVCVFGIVLDGGNGEDNSGPCQNDQDCPSGEICTEEDSDPPNLCIFPLSCETDRDCQTGLSCGDDGVCR